MDCSVNHLFVIFFHGRTKSMDFTCMVHPNFFPWISKFHGSDSLDFFIHRNSPLKKFVLCGDRGETVFFGTHALHKLNITIFLKVNSLVNFLLDFGAISSLSIQRRVFMRQKPLKRWRNMQFFRIYYHANLPYHF